MNRFKVLWLLSRGGRTEEELLVDEFGEYVMMNNGDHGNRKIYVPPTEELKLQFHNKTTSKRALGLILEQEIELSTPHPKLAVS